MGDKCLYVDIKETPDPSPTLKVQILRRKTGGRVLYSIVFELSRAVEVFI